MFLKNNMKKVRSIFSNVAIAGVAATALIWGANTSVINAQTESVETNAPSGGTTNKFLDFTGNGTTDWVTISATAGGPYTWKVAGNPASPVPNQAFIRIFDYGSAADDSIVVGDYIGDAKVDLALYRNPTVQASTPATWYVSQFPNGTAAPTIERSVVWGDSFSDTGTTGDFDGDGKNDYAVIRVQADPQVGGQAASIYWYILSSSTNTSRIVKFGEFRNAAGTPATGPAVFNGADFNGDGRDELIYITRNAAGTVVNYFIGDSITGAGVITRSYGNYNSDYGLTPADYTGDGRADFVAVRQTAADGVAVWYVMNGATGVVTATRFGIADPLFTDGDIPVRGDYDGDNRHDIAVWRPSNQTFYYISSQFNNIQAQQWGAATDTPLGAFGQY